MTQEVFQFLNKKPQKKSKKKKLKKCANSDGDCMMTDVSTGAAADDNVDDNDDVFQYKCYVQHHIYLSNAEIT